MNYPLGNNDWKKSALLRGITSKIKEDFYCMNCHHSFRTKSMLESHKKICGNKDFCNVVIFSEDTKVLEFNQNQKSYKAPFIIYADLEYLTERLFYVKIILKIHLL